MPLGFLSVFKRSQASFPFEALNSAFLSSCQKDVRHPVEIRWGTRAFPMVSTGYSDILSSSELKDEPSFQSLQGNPALFCIRESRCPSHLRRQTQSDSHIHIGEGSLVLRCLWKVAIPLELKVGNQLSSQHNLGYTELFSSCCAELGVPLDLGQCSCEISGVG